jgi:putative spermidine/putrescine transport system permease protein
VFGGLNTPPLELNGLTTTVTNPEIHALGTITSGVSFPVIGTAPSLIAILRRRAALLMT